MITLGRSLQDSRRWRMTAIVTCLIAVGILRCPAGSAQVSTQTPNNHLRSGYQAQPPGRIQFNAKPAGLPQTSVAPKRPTSSRDSMIRMAAEGQVLAEVPAESLRGNLVNRNGGNVQQVGFLEDHGRCGPVCDCGHCGVEPGCGMEAVIVEPACGMEPVCGIEAACGCEPVCGMEPACGIEPGCGMEYGYGSLGCTGTVGCDCGGCDGGGCDSVGGPAAVPVFLPILRINWSRFQFFAGSMAYSGPLNYVDAGPAGSRVLDGSGSFGFHQGVNEGRSLRRWLGVDLAAQLGLRATQSNLRGSEFSDSSRNQIFLTGGLFRRVDYGLQYGAVLDYLNDDWYFQGDLLQIRGEVSWRTGRCHDFGVRYTAALNSNISDTTVLDDDGQFVTDYVQFEAIDQYRLFYRRILSGGGDAMGFLGGTDEGNFLMGSHLNLPLREKLMLATSTTYVVGEGASNQHRNEHWNLSIALVYRPGGPNGCGRYCRPLFDVADNGSFLVEKWY
ncbi:DUF6666 family protein [Crateriforma conspicua]|nr:DUF6666 family protein [Crateriforma conspicua]